MTTNQTVETLNVCGMTPDQWSPVPAWEEIDEQLEWGCPGGACCIDCGELLKSMATYGGIIEKWDDMYLAGTVWFMAKVPGCCQAVASYLDVMNGGGELENKVGRRWIDAPVGSPDAIGCWERNLEKCSETEWHYTHVANDQWAVLHSGDRLCIVQHRILSVFVRDCQIYGDVDKGDAGVLRIGGQAIGIIMPGRADGVKPEVLAAAKAVVESGVLG